MKRNREETEKTKQSILIAAERLFIEQGYNQTSLEEIARTAGYTRGPIHWHFKNKLGLLLALREKEKTPIQELSDLLKKDPSKDPLEELLKTTHFVFKRMEKEPGRRRLLQLMVGCEFGAFKELIDVNELSIGCDAMTIMLEIFEFASSRKVLKEAWTPQNAALTFYGLVSGLILEWVRGRQTYTMTEDASHAIEVFIKSIHSQHCI